MEQKTALAADPMVREHLLGREHPERPERFDAVMAGLDRAGLRERLARIERRAITAPELELCHSARYLRQARLEIEAGYPALSTGDTDVTRNTWEVALHAAGSVLNAVDAVAEGRVRNAFCAVRPPGHHATGSRGMGFCVFNNVALGARYAQRRHGLERVMIVDWDVHHGNGTQEIFYEDPTVFFVSTHQWPLYPGTGRADETGDGPGAGTTMNFPLPRGSGRAEILPVFQEMLAPAAESFRPDLLMISAGFDSREGDPLGGFTLADADFADLTRELIAIADRHAHGRLVSVLEGGYNLAGLASAAAAHVGALLG